MKYVAMAGLALISLCSQVFAQTTSTSTSDQQVQLKGSLNASGTEATPTLKAAAEMGILPTTAVVMKNCPLSHYRGEPMSFFSLKIKNLSDQVAIIDGDNSTARVQTSEIVAKSGGSLIKADSQNLSPKQKELAAVVTVGTLGLAGVIFGEMMTPEQHNKRDFGRSVGIDGVRHDIEAGRFGARLLMPGDETEGWMAFQYSDTQAIKSLKVPVWFSPMRSAPTYLDVPIGQASSL